MTQKINIIAEIAQGFEGNKKLADLLLSGSINSGADIVKFQLIYAHELCIKEYKYFDFFKTLDVPETKWHKELEKEGGKILRMDDYNSVYRSIHIAFGNREMLIIESRKVEYQDKIYPTYTVAISKYNTKYREILTKISNFTDINDKNIIKQIEILFTKIYDALENPKSVTINNNEAKIIFSSHKDVSHTKFQSRD